MPSPSPFAYNRAAQRILQENPDLATQTGAPAQRRSTDEEDVPASVWGRHGARYVNRESHRRYKPHHQAELEFVRGDAPRRWLLKGGEGCVGAETLIEGTPVAEWSGGLVKTLYGPSIATKAYLKGQADLYRVRTETGRSVVVTLEHRFLTLTGWDQLRDLAVGTLIAVRGNEHDQPDDETPRDWRDRYSGGSRPCDELSTPRAVDVLSRLQQPATIHDVLWSDPVLDVDRPYRTHSEGLEDASLFGYHVGQLLLGRVDGELLHKLDQLDLRYLDRRDLDDIGRLLLRSISQSWLDREAAAVLLSTLSDTGCSTASRRREQQWPDNSALNGRAREFGPYPQVEAVYPLECSSHSELTDSSHYNGFWDKIQQIEWVRYDNYYDLSVPGAEHYEAGGIWHHNSGKSVAGVIKTLERLRRGMSGIMGSPTLVHFRKSLWPEFRRWCPRNAVIPAQRYRLDLEWQPNQPFELVFQDMGWGQATLLCGGFDSPGSWEGPNVNFGHYDEGRHSPGPGMAKVLDGRCRISGPCGQPPQWYVTTTPRKSRLSTSPQDMQYHWLFEMFGPWNREGEDPYRLFKEDSAVTTLRMVDNQMNLAEGFVAARTQSLTEKEARILADAEWEDDDDVQRFLPTMHWWDALYRADLPPVGMDPLVVALDAATGRQSTASDCFGLVAMGRLPGTTRTVVPRYVQKWQARAGYKINYYRSSPDEEEGPGDVLRRLIATHNVLQVTFDPHQLVFVAQQMEQEGLVWIESFSQAGERLEADRLLYDTILQHEIVHDGNADLRSHIDNADRKVDDDGHRFRLVQGRGKIDLAVCTAMANKKLRELDV